MSRVAAKKVVGQAKALAGSRTVRDQASPDLSGHLATFSRKLKARGEDSEATILYAQTVVDLARHEGISVPQVAKKSTPAKRPGS